MNDPQDNSPVPSIERCIRLAQIEENHTVGASSPDPQNEPRTCPYCDQPRQDTFENRFRFDCGTSLRADDHKTVKQGDACRIRAQLAAAQAEALELREDANRFVWLAQQGGGFAHDEGDRGISTHKWGEWASGPFTIDDFRHGIDTARAALAKEGQR